MPAAPQSAAGEGAPLWGSFSGRMCSVSQGSRGSDTPVFLLQKTHRFIYYPDTGWAVGADESDFEGWAFPFPGVTLIEDFVTPEEEAEMVQLMDRDPWKLSQSGRRKQVGGARAGLGEEGRAGQAGERGLSGLRACQALTLKPPSLSPFHAFLCSHPPRAISGQADLGVREGRAAE